MADVFAQLAQFVLLAIGMGPVPDVATLGIAIALVAVTAIIVSVAFGTPLSTGGTEHPLRAIDISTLLPQSDPDAAGHPRPRAPGVVRAV